MHLLTPPLVGPLRSRSSGGGSGGIAAKDALGNDVKSAAWLATHGKGDHSLVQGLKASQRGAIVETDWRPAPVGSGAAARAIGLRALTLPHHVPFAGRPHLPDC